MMTPGELASPCSVMLDGRIRAEDNIYYAHERQTARVSLRMIQVLIALVLTAVVPGHVLCTSIALQSIAKMTTRADLIVRGLPEVGSAASMWREGHRVIVTRTPVIVRETLYGDIKSGTRIVVETFGGFVAEDDVRMTVPGSPTFREGEEVVLFLARDSRGTLRTLDLAAGKFEVRMREGKEILTRRDLGTANVVGPDRKLPDSLDALRAQVKAAAANKTAP